jgi:hypothetical protein
VPDGGGGLKTVAANLDAGVIERSESKLPEAARK